MAEILDKIVAYKGEEVAALKADLSLAEMMTRADAAEPVRPFVQALLARHARNELALIAEIKKASPSRGLIREDFNPEQLARAYAEGGAACLSVLTDGPSFQGANEYLDAAHDATSLPCLRKDFMIDPYQVAEARAHGADCILIIMAAVDDHLARDILSASRDLGMDSLIEIHDRAELDRALELDAQFFGHPDGRFEGSLIGINNRDLKTFETRLETTEELAPLISDEHIVVSESGLSSHADLTRLAAAGVKTFLVGEHLMRADDVAEATRLLLTGNADAGSENQPA